MFYASFLVALAVASLNGVFATLYPTQPISDTIYSTGSSAWINWIDDSLRPHLYDMSPVKIDLYAGDHVGLVSLTVERNLLRINEGDIWRWTAFCFPRLFILSIYR